MMIRMGFALTYLLLGEEAPRSFAKYWKYFVARFNDVHAFGYNFAGSERIWMKFGNSEYIVWIWP